MNRIIPETRCPYCHENVSSEDKQFGCPGCRAWHHLECWREHSGCSSCDYKLGNKGVVVENIVFESQKMQWPERGSEYSLSLSQIHKIIDKIKSDPNYEEVYSVAKDNSNSKLYLIGGRVYRAVAEVFHGRDCSLNSCDWDFLAEKLSTFTSVPKKWHHESYSDYGGRVLVNPYKIGKQTGCIKFAKPPHPSKGQDGIKIDLVNLSKLYGIAVKYKHSFLGIKFSKQQNTLDDYFNAVPMRVQAIAFDPLEDKFYFGKSLADICNETISVNNYDALTHHAELHNKGISAILREKADSLGFKVSDWRQQEVIKESPSESAIDPATIDNGFYMMGGRP